MYSSFIAELEKQGSKVMLYHQISEKAIEEVKLVQPNIVLIKQIPAFIESPKARLWRESNVYARLLRNKKILSNNTIMAFWNNKVKGWKKRVLLEISEILGSAISSSYKAILKFDKLHEKEIARSKIISKIEKDFDVFNPDFVLNLHQRAPISAPVIVVAKKRKIKTATVIFSWDNVPKARLISRYDRYFVWSELMKSELCLLYPEIKNDNVEVVGTPQFEFYFQDKLFRAKEDFFKEYGLNPNKKTICFSANDSSSPYEQNYLEDLGSELSKIDGDIRPQVLFRRCPVDKSDRFDEVLKKYKSFIFPIDPDWRLGSNHSNSFSITYPSYNDLQLLVNTIRHCDAVINFGSTMAHDFAVFQKPCLYLNYDPINNSVYKVEDVYKFQHFKSLDELDAVGWINHKNEIIEKIKQVIENPNQVGKDKKVWMKKIVKYPLQDCSENLAKTISNLV
ncbi:hypothetical protein PQ462_20500 [Flavobacterium sp. KACC 22758]|uniref:hypothetical protein n=1 Tax=Flavobacterium sp. KACC 22758 TaxID=3025667 RepID=UPI002365557C|nr:hypothetical protein [Flavobacterium sp. KACC 22758]WDF59083.1 hypothetical protein PQ462_20500 [Flavobacterium sp. KACC 22758]